MKGMGCKDVKFKRVGGYISKPCVGFAYLVLMECIVLFSLTPTGVGSWYGLMFRLVGECAFDRGWESM